MTLKQLADAIYERERSLRPNIPSYAIPRKTFNDRTANGLTKAIKAYFDYKGIFCQRTGNEGRYRPGDSVVDVVGRTRLMKGTWLPGLNNGQGDLTAIVGGKYVSIEVKIGKDYQSDKQKEFEAQIKAAGGEYYIVKSWNNFLDLPFSLE